MPLDKVDAIKWYSYAAESGYAAAQYYLGDCYAKGEGTPQNSSDAMKWYNVAANQEYKVAKHTIRTINKD